MNILNPRKRARKANSVALKVFFSYALIVTFRKLYRKKTYARKLDKKHYKNAARIKVLVLSLKGLFVKAGQLMSMMSNILPDAYAEVLESLQDQAPGHSFAETKKLIEEELKDDLGHLFADFDEDTLASASIGQVHKAILKTGETVAVKIQHPYIEQIAEADLNIIEGIIKRVAKFFKINGIDQVYLKVRKMIEEELDYVHEGKAMQVIAENLKEEERIVIPTVFSEYSSKRILVTSFEKGTKVTNIAQIDEWKIDRSKLAEELILIYCKMILRDGYYHADPHPGNIHVSETGKIILLDFGAVAVMSEGMRKEIPKIIQAIVRKDFNKILESLQIMGFVGDDFASKKVAKKLVKALSDFLQSEIKIDNMNFKDISIDDIRGSSIENLWKSISIKELSKTMQVPKDWIMLDRTIVLLSGISAHIAPKLNPIDVVKPYLKKQILSFKGIKDFLVDTVRQQFTTLLSIPVELDKFLVNANNGDLEIAVVNPQAEKIYKGMQQLIFVVVALFAAVMYEFKNSIFWLVIAILSSLLVLRSMWKNRK